MKEAGSPAKDLARRRGGQGSDREEGMPEKRRGGADLPEERRHRHRNFI